MLTGEAKALYCAVLDHFLLCAAMHSTFRAVQFMKFNQNQLLTIIAKVGVMMKNANVS